MCGGAWVSGGLGGEKKRAGKKRERAPERARGFGGRRGGKRERGGERGVGGWDGMGWDGIDGATSSSPLRLAVCARVAVVGEHGGDAARRGAPARVHHDQQLHQVVVDGRARGLDQKHVAVFVFFGRRHVGQLFRCGVAGRGRFRQCFCSSGRRRAQIRPLPSRAQGAYRSRQEPRAKETNRETPEATNEGDGEGHRQQNGQKTEKKGERRTRND